MFLVTAGQMSRMDKKTIEDFGIPGAVLMENAGRGATKILLSKFGDLKERKIGIIAGPGNNGGDGFVVARYLAGRGISVRVYLLSSKSKVKGDAALNLSLLSDINVPVIEVSDESKLLLHRADMADSDIWVDAIFGTGLHSTVKGLTRTVMNLINTLKKPVMAIDIPSGLHPDTGLPLGVCIKADVTVTFGYAKTGLLTYPGMEYCGSIYIVDIGIPHHIAENEALCTHLLTPEIISACYSPRTANTHKGTTGHLLVVAGSKGKTGAAALTSEAAMRSGAGLVTLGLAESARSTLDSLIPEVMTLFLAETPEGTLSESALDLLKTSMKTKNCIAAGPGLGTGSHVSALVNEILSESICPVVIDADGLNALSGDLTMLSQMTAPVILTPHPKEMARLTGKSVETIQNNRVQIAKTFAETYNVHLILKGARTVIAHPDGSVYINPTGNPAMASGGMGDALTGMIAGFITQGYSPIDSSHMGVYLHGAAADLLSTEKGPVGIVASDIISRIPEIISWVAGKTLAPVKHLEEWF